MEAASALHARRTTATAFTLENRRAIESVSAMADALAAQLAAQAASVGSIAADADASAAHAGAGVAELQQLRRAPSSRLRDVAVCIALSLAALLAFLHWFSP